MQGDRDTLLTRRTLVQIATAAGLSVAVGTVAACTRSAIVPAPAESPRAIGAPLPASP